MAKMILTAPGAGNIMMDLKVCADDLLLLEKMAAEAGKTRDVVVSGILFQALTEERQFRIHMEDQVARHGMR